MLVASQCPPTVAETATTKKLKRGQKLDAEQAESETHWMAMDRNLHGSQMENVYKSANCK